MAFQSETIQPAPGPGETPKTPRITRAQWLVLLAAFLGWMFDGVEIGLFPLVARPALRELLGDSGDKAVGEWNGVIVACFLLGAAIGGMFFGWLGDRIGRVRAMVASILIYSLFMGAGAFTAYAWQLGLFVFISALGMGGEWAVAVALVVECWPEKHRPMLAGAIGAAANFGFLFIGIVAVIFPVMPGSWRWLMLVGAIPAVLALFVSMVIPESEKWKASVKTPHKQPIVEIFAPGIRKKTLLAIVFSAIPLIGTWAAVSGWIPLWVEQAKEVEMVDARRPDLDLTHAEKGELKDKLEAAKKDLPADEWSSIAGSAARWKALVQIMMATGAIVFCFVAPVIGGMAGRRPVYFGLCLISLVSCACLSRLLTPENFWFWPLVWFVGGVTAAFYGWLPLYLPELFPTRMRATGQGLSFNSGRVVAAVGALSMGQLVRVLGGNYGSAIANITLIYVLGLVLIWLAPETKGKPLPE